MFSLIVNCYSIDGDGLHAVGIYIVPQPQQPPVRAQDTFANWVLYTYIAVDLLKQPRVLQVPGQAMRYLGPKATNTEHDFVLKPLAQICQVRSRGHEVMRYS